MIGRLWLNKCQICHWRASSLLFMPNGCIVLTLFIRWASRAFLTKSRLLRIRMSSIGMRHVNRMASLVKVKWYWCGCAELLVIQDRTSVFLKAFTDLTFGLSDVLKMAPFTFYQVYEIFGVARYGVRIFCSFVGCKKSIVCLTLSKKRTGIRQRGWLHFSVIPAGCWPEEFVQQCRMD